MQPGVVPFLGGKIKKSGDQPLMGELDRGVLGQQQTGIDQTADQTIRRMR